MLRVGRDEGNGVPYSGKYLHVGEVPHALGRMIAQGAEAMVFEAIDLRAGTLAGVVKVCRFPPGTPEYQRWAVPVRFELNEKSDLPDVELYPAALLSVPGGMVKLQPYLAPNPATAWAARSPAAPIFGAAKGDPEGAVEIADGLLARHGSRGILLEAKGHVLLAEDDLDAAAEALEAAYAAHAEEGNAGMYSSALLLSRAWRTVYQSQETHGSAEVRLDLGDGVVLSNIHFGDSAESAADDTLQDRSMYLLLEVLAKEPFFVGGLGALADELLEVLGGTELAAAIVACAEQIDPVWEVVAELRTTVDRKAADEAAAALERGALNLPPPPPSSTIPKAVKDGLETHRAHYDPEPDAGTTAEARARAARVLWSEGDLSGAEREARRAVVVDPSVAGHRTLLAEVLEASGRDGEALEVLRKSVTELSSAETYLGLAEFLQRQGDDAQAKTEFLRALLSGPREPWRVHLGLGASLERIGDLEEAIDNFRTAHRMAPDEAWPSIHLAQALRKPFLEGDTSAEAESRIREAYELISVAAERFPESMEVLFWLAQSLVLAGHPCEAVPVLVRAQEIAPRDDLVAKFARDAKHWCAQVSSGES